MTEPTFYTVPQIAERWSGCSEWFVREEIRRKNLPAARLGGRWQVTPADLYRYEDAHRNVPKVRGRAS